MYADYNVFDMEQQCIFDVGLLETAILDLVTNPVLVKDEQLRYVLVNRASTIQLLSYSIA